MLSLRKARLLTQTLRPRKVANFAALWSSFHYSRMLGKSRHWGNPAKIGFEPTTHCNLRCPECPSGLRSFTRPTGMGDLELFKSTMDQLHKDLIYLLLYFQGEPYLNPNFLEMAAYAKEKGIYSATSTNGHYLSESRAEETIKSGLSEIIISIDGTTQDTYAAYRVGGNLEKVKQGVRNLVAARKRLNSLHPFIMIQFLVVKPNQHQIEDIKQMGEELGVDKVMFKTAQIYDYEKGSELIPTIDRYSRYKKQANGSYQIKNSLENQCWKLWHGAEITWDGKVLPCCFDKDADYEMGSLQEKSFEEIWRNPIYESFRGNLLKSRAEIEICKNCSEGTKVWG
ncbi:MAG: radical SAM/SPASM domain-containing protein [Bacteroidia bacterium]|nr:radical SAM/SPASM domain-containing protein [Bacteroidia bacterium]